MKNDLVQLGVAMIALVAGGSIEELFPHIAGVGVPVLLMASLFYAGRRTVLSGILFAVAAGAFEDSLSSLPPFLSVSFFVLMAIVVRKSRAALPVMSFAYPLFLTWLWLWLPEMSDGFLVRLFVSIPVGFLSAWAVYGGLEWLDRKGAVDEK